MEYRNLNKNGVKDSCNMWRTVKGIKYEQWTSDNNIWEEEIAKYPNYKFIKRGYELFRSKEPIS